MKIDTIKKLDETAAKITSVVTEAVTKGCWTKVEHETDKYELESIKETLRRAKNDLPKLGVDCGEIFKSSRYLNYVANEVVYGLRRASRKNPQIKTVVFGK